MPVNRPGCSGEAGSLAALCLVAEPEDLRLVTMVA